MKFQVMTGILFTLLSRRKVSAGELAGKYGVSVRTVYRYIDEMTCSNIPVDVARGANGGIYISDAFKLPKGLLTREEYASAIGAMNAVNEQLCDGTLSSAIDKLSAQVKAERLDASVSGNILVDGGSWGGGRQFSETLALIERAVEERKTLEINYVDRGGERSQRAIMPHLLVLKQNIWYVYAYCRMRGDFRLFKIGRIRTVRETGEIFERIHFKREDVPLSFWTAGENTVEARFSISPEALPFAEEWLGIGNVYERDGAYFAEVSLPDDESLVGKILSAGAGFRVLSPASLAQRVEAEAEKIASSYETV